MEGTTDKVAQFSFHYRQFSQQLAELLCYLEYVGKEKNFLSLEMEISRFFFSEYFLE